MQKKMALRTIVISAVLFIICILSFMTAMANTPAEKKAFVSYLPILGSNRSNYHAFTLSTVVTGSSGSQAAFTTVNEAIDGTGHCKNGNPNVNCNIYDGKQYVWLNGGPNVAYLGDGTYFFAVLDPGGQADPNDGGVKNLSDTTASPWPPGSKNADGSSIPSGDPYTNRTFSVTGKAVSYSGSHNFDSNKVRLMPYDDTTIPGGVYIIAICSLAHGYPVDPSTCKYDAFKIQQAGLPHALPLTIVKDANGAYENTFTWGISKDVDKTRVKQIGGEAEFNYTVKVIHDNGAISDVKVTGTIHVINPNVDDNGNTLPVAIDSIADQLSDGTACTVTNGGPQTLAQFETDFAYECTLGSEVPTEVLDNTATAGWSEQFLGNGALLEAGTASFTFSNITFKEIKVDDCVTVTDPNAPVDPLGTACSTDPSPKTFTYRGTVTVPQYGCICFTNTAAFMTNTTGTTGQASQSVEVCGPVETGALTMGFWQNKNGQSIIKSGASTGGVCQLGTWLRQFAPFQDLGATATCADVATYIYDVIKAANASGATMNSMLKAQMLATALDVFFSDPALGGNKIDAPKPIGVVVIDLTHICKTFTFCNTFEDVSPAFGGANSLTISQMLSYAASQSNIGGSLWYGNVKATQELAKDAFDAINNEAVFAP